MPKAYDPSAIEEKWANFWLKENLFHVPPGSGTANNFTVLLPPPNVTGRLHMGHMFEQTETDVIVRWQRMSGRQSLWVPGTDHAGIATQMLVERQLTTEGTSRHSLGREKFVERVWQWKQLYGSAILEQMQRLGASLDWQREYFTMDERLSVAVREAFVRLHEQGLIYRGAYIVNWCPDCRTAISDLEVVHEEHHGKLWEIRYPLSDNSGSIVIATTRPETMLGDTAVAVNPNDPRYTAFHGKTLRLPLIGREIPIVLDDHANPEFGTGAVKVTPAHDPNDFAIGQRHHLPSINVMDDTAHINENGGPYAGLERYQARKRILADLEAEGFLVAAKDHTYAIGRCDRSKTIVEPRLSTQWFVRIQPLADKAIAAVNQGHIAIGPDQFRKVYLEWMSNIHDWCISRQLWWGHRIPAWHCKDCREIIVARETPSACPKCGSRNLQQETDVLDTWFSSGLLPFTVFGWPQSTADLDAFYPTSLLVTGFDILFFWVARMIMLGCHFMLEAPLTPTQAATLTPADKQEMARGPHPRPLRLAVPFREVHIHALVRDADRQKMSKTKGNVVDPIEIIQRYGTDATRFTLAAMASPGTDIAFSEARTEGYRAFANKIWNAARFIFMQRDRARDAGITPDLATLPAALAPDPSATLEDRWITSRLSATIAEVNAALADYRFDTAANIIYQFFWGDFCDWYLEIVKLRLEYNSDAQRRQADSSLTTLLAVFEASLRLLSPFMPFITEELWHALYQDRAPSASIALTSFPQAAAPSDPGLLTSMAQLQNLVVMIRARRKDLGVPDKEAVAIVIGRANRSALSPIEDVIIRLARVSHVDYRQDSLAGADIVSDANYDLQVLYEKQIDPVAERARLLKDLARLEKEWDNNQRQLSNDAFLLKAPENVVQGLRSRAIELATLLEKTRGALASLST